MPSLGRDYQDLRGLAPACHTDSSAAEQGFEDLRGAMVDNPHVLEVAGRKPKLSPIASLGLRVALPVVWI